MDFLHNLTPPILGWWLKVDAANPICIYYFGPFVNQAEAEASKAQYLADLYQDHTKIIHAETRYCQPRQLTIFEEDLNIKDLEESSGQFFINLVQHHRVSSILKPVPR